MKYLIKMRYVACLLCFLWGLKAFSQQIKVIDAETRQPMAGVTVINQDKSKALVTDGKGIVEVGIFTPSDKLIFSHVGYRQESFTLKELIKLKNVVYLELSSEQLNEVVLSVSKWQQRKKDLPVKIASIRAADIRFTNPQTSADLLQHSGKVFVQKSQLGGGSPMIRGFATNRLLLSVDGVRMNNAIFRGGNIQNVISVDPFSIQKTEVIFGPGSMIYGSDAIGGVMNFYTHDPLLSSNEQPTINGEFNLRYASANFEKTANLKLRMGWQKWASLTTVSVTDFDDLVMGKYGPDEYLRPTYVITKDGQDMLVNNSNPRRQKPSGYSQFNFLQKIKYVPSENTNYQLGLYYTTTSDFSRYDRLIRPRGDGLRSAVWDYGPQSWAMANFQMQRNIATVIYDSFKLTSAYQFFEESRMDRNFGSSDLFTTKENVHAYSVNVDFEKHLTPSWNLFYGSEFIHNRVFSKGNVKDIYSGSMEETASRYPDNSTWESIAFYMNSQYKWRSNLNLLAGIRYNHVFVDAEFDNRFYEFPFSGAHVTAGAITGSLGLSWTPSESWQFTLNGTTAFRAPNIDDVGKIFDSEPGSVVVPNPKLKHEYAYTGELGISKDFGGKLILSAATYYTFLNNALVRRDFHLNGETTIEYQGELSKVQAIQNAAKAHVYGLELGLEAVLTKELHFISNVNWTKGEEELDDKSKAPLRHAAPLFGDAHLVWKEQFFKIDFFTNFNGKIASNDLAPSESAKEYIYAKDNNGRPYVPAWQTINLRTSAQLNKSWETTLTWENITNELYRPYSSGISAAGSNLIIGVRYLF